MNLKDKKTIDFFTGKIDKKNKLNRSKKNIDVNLLTEIDKGITIENLMDLSKKYSLPIYKYQTQITIHGIFSELDFNYNFGYKHIFQNKNKSIGIKYGAIDETKRQFLKNPLSYIGFNYYRNSNTNEFTITKRSFNIIDVKNDVIELQKILEKIDKNLFFGGANIVQGNYMGAIYTILNLTINAIEQKNIPLFLENLGLTNEFIKNKENEIEREKIEREKIYQLEKIEREKIKNLKNNELQKIRENEFKNYTFELPKENNIYINIFNDWQNNLRYKLIKVLPQGRKKMQRYLDREYNTLTDALNDLNDFSTYNSSLYEKISKFGLKEYYRIN